MMRPMSVKQTILQTDYLNHIFAQGFSCETYDDLPLASKLAMATEFENTYDYALLAKKAAAKKAAASSAVTAASKDQGLLASIISALYPIEEKPTSDPPPPPQTATPKPPTGPAGSDVINAARHRSSSLSTCSESSDVYPLLTEYEESATLNKTGLRCRRSRKRK